MILNYKDYAFIYENSKLQCAVLNKKREVIKTMDFAIEGCFDFTFNAMNFLEETNVLTFEIDNENPLYKPFIKLINNSFLLIDDDLTREPNKKFLMIERQLDKICIKFNKSNEDNSFIFNITIINITFDLRSKIDQQNLNTKSKLLDFFKDLNDTFGYEINKTYEKVIK